MQERVPSPADALPRVLPPPHVDYGRLVEEMIVPRLLAGDVEIVLSDRAVPLPERPPGSAERIPARYLVPRDCHPAYEVCWVVEGRCELWVARRTIALDSRRACIVRPGEPKHKQVFYDAYKYAKTTFTTPYGVRAMQVFFRETGEMWNDGKPAKVVLPEAVPRINAVIQEEMAADTKK